MRFDSSKSLNRSGKTGFMSHKMLKSSKKKNCHSFRGSKTFFFLLFDHLFQFNFNRIKESLAPKNLIEKESKPEKIESSPNSNSGWGTGRRFPVRRESSFGCGRRSPVRIPSLRLVSGQSLELERQLKIFLGGGRIAQWIAYSLHTQRPQVRILEFPKKIPRIFSMWTVASLIDSTAA